MKRKLAQIGFIIIDIGIVIFSFLFVAWLRTGTKVYIAHYYQSIIAFGIIWLGVGLWGQKFSIKVIQNGKAFAKNMLKNDVWAIFIVFGLIVLFQKFYFSRYIVFGTILLTSALEFLFFVGLYYALQFHKENESYASTAFVTKSKRLEENSSDRFIRDATKMVPILDSGHYHPSFINHVEELSHQADWLVFLSINQRLFEFIAKYLDLPHILQTKTKAINSELYSNISNHIPGSLQMFINLHKINDFRRLNQYIIKVNEILVQGGVFICCGETKSERRNRIFKRYSPYLGVFVYLIDFMIRRVMPKIPIVQGWYFALTKGKNRAISETEMIGRFYFCGFDLIGKDEIDSRMYFILKKVKEPSQDPNPSYGPIIKLKRKGKDGKIIYISKLRTMHPYSEYLQDYVYRTCNLQDGGKFCDDFRVTVWGKVFRSLWIDELPQILNFLRGEITLVGVRALSEHYFNLYPKDLQELRCKTKPGLVPPFYADMPITFDEIVQSERTYLESKLKNPFATDCKYFWKAFCNIIFNHARSK